MWTLPDGACIAAAASEGRTVVSANTLVSVISDLARWKDGHHCLCGIRRGHDLDYKTDFICVAGDAGRKQCTQGMRKSPTVQNQPSSDMTDTLKTSCSTLPQCGFIYKSTADAAWGRIYHSVVSPRLREFGKNVSEMAYMVS